MKAIIKVNTESFYSKYNFLTFEVFEIGGSWVSFKGLHPSFPQNEVDFTFDEIFIVDIENELKKAMFNSKNGNEATRKFTALKKYCEFKNIKINLD
ncbi:hypothetical protein PG275_09165 [Riemerella anatipestifer]|nr:hypothetical protein [Riemerella anatipestifer]